MTKNKFITILSAVMVLVSWLLVRSCSRPATPPETTPLAADTALQIDVKDRVVTVRTPEDSESEYVPDYSHVTVYVSTEGVVDLKVKSKGFVLRPVIGPMMTMQTLDLALGAQVGYWNRVELYGGMMLPNPLGAWAGVGYRLDQIKLSNTSVYVAYTTNKDIATGVLLRF